MSDDTPTQRYPDGFTPPQPPTPGVPSANAPDAVPTEAYAPAADAVPTEAYTPAADAIPTEAYAPAASVTPPPPARTTPLPADTGADDGSDPRTRTLITVLAIVGSVLLLVVIGLLLWIALGGSSGAPAPVATDPETSSTPNPTPSDSSTPEPTPTETTPTPTPTATLPPPPPEHAIGAFLADTTTVNCSGVSSVMVNFAWIASGTKAWFGVGTTDASAAPYEEVPLEAEYPFAYQCGQASKQQIYTLTVLTDDGTKEHATVTIREN